MAIPQSLNATMNLRGCKRRDLEETVRVPY
jgi:hypothetical protein